MKTKVKYVVKYICFLALLAATVSMLYRVLKWKDTTGNYLSSVEQLYNTDENLMDVVFLGSSHCYCGIYPAVLWRDCGIAAFNMAVSGQDRDSTYHFLIELYKTQKPKVVYVDLHPLLFDRHGVESNVYRNYLSMKLSPNSVSHINDYFEPEQRKDYYLRFPIVHTRYAELQRKDFQTYSPNSFGRGAFFAWEVGGAANDPEAEANRTIGELSEANVEWLDKIIALTQENGSALEFIFIPMRVTAENQQIINAAVVYLQEKGVPFTNFNAMREKLNLYENNDYLDGNHLNAYGAEKLTSYFKDSLVNRYNIPDHKGDRKYVQWDMDLRWYNASYIEKMLAETPSAFAYVQMLKSFEDAWTVISLEGEFYNAGTDYFEVLAPLGMDYDDYLEGGKWIYRDGTLTKLCGNVENTCAYLELNEIDTLRVGYYGLCENSNILVGKNPYQSRSPLTLVTYNTLLGEVTVSREF